MNLCMTVQDKNQLFLIALMNKTTIVSQNMEDKVVEMLLVHMYSSSVLCW